MENESEDTKQNFGIKITTIGLKEKSVSVNSQKKLV